MKKPKLSKQKKFKKIRYFKNTTLNKLKIKININIKFKIFKKYKNKKTKPIKLNNISFKKLIIKETDKSKVSKKLETIYKISQSNPKKIFKNLYNIIYDIDTLFFAYEKIKSNEGAMTLGTDKVGIDTTSYLTMQKLSIELKNKTFRFQPARRIEIPKPGKKKKRPLGIPNFKDKIVQEAIRLVLSAIYEPEFQRLDVNYGFRPKKSVAHAILKIKENTRGMTHAIEGDIEGAYDNVNHKKMEHILKNKISDNRLIKLIYNGFKAGIIKYEKYEDTILGVPQGGILSPLLFNIYMHEFDKMITEHLNSDFNNINILENRKDSTKVKSRLYELYRGRAKEAARRLKKLIENKDLKNLNDTEKSQIKIEQNKIKLNKKLQLHTKSTSQKKIKLRFLYIRYADDWIIFNNANNTYNENLKNIISDWLINNLILKLSADKTKITEIKKQPAKFLGHEIKNNQKYLPVNETSQKDPRTNNINNNRRIIIPKIIYKRRITTDVFITIDRERVMNRLKIKSFINENNKPKRNAILTSLKTFEIVKKYKEILLGFFNFYYPTITFKSTLLKYYYLLTYSCYHTIANRERLSIAKVIRKYGKNLQITWSEKIKTKQGNIIDKERKISLLTYPELMEQTEINLREITEQILKEIRYEKNTKFNDTILPSQNIKDFLSLKINLKTKIKLTNYCTICGAINSRNNRIESHHVKHLRKIGKDKTNFVQNIMDPLNRKQIIICRKCHNKIHRGEYDNIKLSDLYDPDLNTY